MARKPVTLVSPGGNEHTLSNPTQIVNLRARGYKTKEHKPTNKSVDVKLEK